MIKKRCSKELVRQICALVEPLLKANPEAATLEVLQHLNNQMKCLLGKRMFREAEEMAYAIFLEFDKFSKKVSNNGPGAR